jgi:hypothetical protein
MKIERRVSRHRRKWWKPKTCSRRKALMFWMWQSEKVLRQVWLGLFSPKEIQLQSYLEPRQSAVMSDTASVVWQQDGVQSHFGRNVRATSFRKFLRGWVTVGQLAGPQHLQILNLAIFPCAVQSNAKFIASSCHTSQMKLTNPCGISHCKYRQKYFVQ